MNTILQKRIDEAAKKICCTDCPMQIIRNCKGCVARENAIETGIFTLQNQWISVDDKLPEEDNVYFVLVDFNGYPQPRVTDFDIKTKKWTGYTGITHWMEIPSLEGGEK